jgi:hypothetical protein
VDHYLKNYVPKTRYYIKYTTDFVTKINSLGVIRSDTLLLTRDVISLYTNIPNHGGLVAVADKLRTDPEMVDLGPFLLHLLKLILTKTTFNDTNYLQIGGTSMGTNIAPSYAILYMDKLECQALKPLGISSESEGFATNIVPHRNSVRPLLLSEPVYKSSSSA